MELMTQEQRFNEISLPQNSTYCVALLAVAVKFELISDKYATNTIGLLNTYFEGIANKTSENLAVSVNTSVIVSNFFSIMFVYLSSHTNWEALELIKNTNVSKLVEKAEAYYNKITETRITLLKAMHPLPNGMYEGMRNIVNVYDNIVKQYRVKDLNNVSVLLEYPLLVTENSKEDSILEFCEYVDNFMIEISILNRKFSDSVIRELKRNLEMSTENLKNAKIKEIEEKIDRVKDLRDKKLEELNKKMQYYTEKQKELDNILNNMSEEELDSDVDEVMSKYDFDIIVVERKIYQAKQKVQNKAESMLLKLEKEMDDVQTQVEVQDVMSNTLEETLKEWLIYKLCVETNHEYRIFTSMEKDVLIHKMSKDWITIQLDDLELTNREIAYVKRWIK